MTLWKTTKIPEFYFDEIERALNLSKKYVSVSEFIRSAIEEKLSKEKSKMNFLIIKDLIFTEAKIKQIHSQIAQKSVVESNKLLNNNINKIIEESLDIDLITFLSKFLKNFALLHPFEDGNKRTALIATDVFLRLNNLKLELKADKSKETKDEVFFWQNSTQQKSIDDIKKFISSHIDNYETSFDVEKETQTSLKENQLMLEKLSK